MDLGILKGDVDKLIEEKAYRQFYMHGLGHWLGLDVHDVGRYDDDRSRTLEVGMIITVEPGIYISEEADVPAQYKGIGVRIEDNLLMTEYGNKNLTVAAPKEIDDIENLMKNWEEILKKCDLVQVFCPVKLLIYCQIKRPIKSVRSRLCTNTF